MPSGATQMGKQRLRGADVAYVPSNRVRCKSKLFIQSKLEVWVLTILPVTP